LTLLARSEAAVWLRVEVLEEVFQKCGQQNVLRCDNGPEFVSSTLLAINWFHIRQHTKALTEQWRKLYNGIRPHSSLGDQTPP
jgi:transposase InsO family protein